MAFGGKKSSGGVKHFLFWVAVVAVGAALAGTVAAIGSMIKNKISPPKTS